jgi:predicted NBD/HSP70 family sugar kinase
MYYGFDIGGSKIALGVFDQERRLQWEKRVATPKSSYEDFLQAVEALVREADERFDQQGSVGSVFRGCRKRRTARCMPPTCLPPAARCAPISARGWGAMCAR